MVLSFFGVKTVEDAYSVHFTRELVSLLVSKRTANVAAIVTHLQSAFWLAELFEKKQIAKQVGIEGHFIGVHGLSLFGVYHSHITWPALGYF